VRKARDEAWELIGRWLYGSLWIGELNTPEYNISKRYEQAEKRLTTPNRLPVDPKKAMRNARANFRSQAAAFQYGQVLRWLEDEQRIDMRPAKFDQAKFKECSARGSDDRRAKPQPRRARQQLREFFGVMDLPAAAAFHGKLSSPVSARNLTGDTISGPSSAMCRSWSDHAK
jgi:hypothetical protein